LLKFLNAAFFVAIWLGMIGPAQTQTEQYWQQLYSSSQGQCGTNLVSLAKQLDDAKKEIADLQKEIENLKGGKK
jgi:hypothetical protein